MRAKHVKSSIKESTSNDATAGTAKCLFAQWLCRMCTALEYAVCFEVAAVLAGNEIGRAGAASLAPSLGRMAQLTSLNLSGTLRFDRVYANAGDAVMMLRVAGCSGCRCAGGFLIVMGFASGEPTGRRCVQLIGSERTGQRRWHRVSQGCRS